MENLTLERVIRDWLAANKVVGRFNDWIYDDGILWKPYHRYWFTVEKDQVISHDKGVMYYTTGEQGDLKVVLEAADPEFLNKLGKMLHDYA